MNTGTGTLEGCIRNGGGCVEGTTIILVFICTQDKLKTLRLLLLVFLLLISTVPSGTVSGNVSKHLNVRPNRNKKTKNITFYLNNKYRLLNDVYLD